jgi:hypothetical protein
VSSPTVPPEIRAAMLAALAPLSKHSAALPEPLPLGQVVRLSDPKATGSAEDLRVLAGHAAGYYLDYFRVNGEISSHGRIHADGRVEPLENYEGQFGITVFPDPAATAREKQRVGEHNARVRALLRHKGFER